MSKITHSGSLKFKGAKKGFGGSVSKSGERVTLGGGSSGGSRSPVKYNNKSGPKQGGQLDVKNAYSTKSLERRLAGKKF